MEELFIKKISFLIPNFGFGGAEFQLVSQIKELNRRKIKSQLIVLGDNHELIDEVKDEAEIILINQKELGTLSGKALLALPKVISKVKKSIAEFAPNVVLANLPITHFLSRLLKQFYALNIPIYQYHHSTEYKIAPLNTFSKKLFHTINKTLAFQDDGHIYISKAVQLDIEANFPAKNGVVIYNSIPRQSISDQASLSALQKFGLTPNSYIIIPGRLHPVKGHEFFFKALATYIKREGINVLNAGYGSTEKSLRTLVSELDINKQVYFTDKISNVVMLSLIKHSKFVVIPSLEEGLGNIAIESLMMGSTVLSSNAGGLPEVIKNKKNGYVFEKNNPSHLKEMFVSLYENFEEKRFVSEQLIKDYETRFTIEEQIQLIIEYLE